MTSSCSRQIKDYMIARIHEYAIRLFFNQYFLKFSYFPWLFVSGHCVVIYCQEFDIAPRKDGIFLSPYPSTLWHVQMAEYTTDIRSHSLVCILHNLISIKMQNCFSMKCCQAYFLKCVLHTIYFCYCRFAVYRAHIISCIAIFSRNFVRCCSLSWSIGLGLTASTKWPL